MQLVEPDPQAPDSSAPTGPEGDGVDPDGSLFRRLKGWAKDSWDGLTDWRKEADEAYDFYSGHQWTAEELQAFAADNRVAPVFNVVGINVNAVAGLEVNNRQDVKYLPRTAGDVQVNELLSSAAMWVRDEAQSEDEESDAFKDATITGLGCTETRKPDEETISLDRRDPTEMFYDRAAKKPNLVDRRFDGRIIMMDTDEALSMFVKRGPDGEPLPPEMQLTPAMLNAKWASLGIKQGGDGIERLDYPTEQSGALGTQETKPKKICIVEIEWFDWVDGRKVMKQAFLGATTVIEVNDLDAWAYNWITGKRDKKKNSWYGIVRDLKDPQKLINKVLATVLHILATNAKGGLMYEQGAFVNQRQAEKDWSNPQKNVELAQGALSRGAIQPRVAPPMPAGPIQLLEFAMGNVRTISGINVELLGSADRDQPASLELQRRQSAVTILASLFDAKRRYHKEQGKTLLSLMKTLPPRMLVRVTVDALDPMLMPPPPPGMTPTPEQQAQAVQQWQQQQQAAQQAKQREMFVQFQLVAKAFADPSLKFDVIVDEAPSSPNQQQEIAAKLAQLAAQGMQLPPEAQAIIVENIGLPSTVADKLAEALSGNNPQVKALQAQVGQATQAAQQHAQEAEQARAELQGVKMDKSVDVAKAKTAQYQAETDRTKVYGEAISKTGGIPDQDGTLHPLAELLIQLGTAQAQTQQQVNDIGTVVAHRMPPPQPPQPMMAGAQ